MLKVNDEVVDGIKGSDGENKRRELKFRRAIERERRIVENNLAKRLIKLLFQFIRRFRP
jgi:hypothetical protein